MVGAFFYNKKKLFQMGYLPAPASSLERSYLSIPYII